MRYLRWVLPIFTLIVLGAFFDMFSAFKQGNIDGTEYFYSQSGKSHIIALKQPDAWVVMYDQDGDLALSLDSEDRAIILEAGNFSSRLWIGESKATLSSKWIDITITKRFFQKPKIEWEGRYVTDAETLQGLNRDFIDWYQKINN